MIPADIRAMVGNEIHRVLMTANLTGSTKEQNAWQLIRILQPYLRPISAHSLSATHIRALLKLIAAERQFGFPKKGIHIRKQMYAVSSECPFKLTTDEWTNFAKLRLWGLAVHGVKDEPRSGFWRVANRGYDFVNGKNSLPLRMYSFRGHPLNTEPIPGEKRVHILEYKTKLPDLEKYRDWRPEERPRTINQATLLGIPKVESNRRHT